MSSHVLASRPPNRRTALMLVATLAAVAAMVGGGWLVTRSSEPDADTVQVTAHFADASPLVPGNKVQLNGLQVGTIAAINLVAGGADGADVVMTLDRSALPLHTDAKVRIEPVSLLGERFLSLDRGSATAPILAEPMVLARENASASVDVDDLVSALDRSASTGLAALVGTLGESIAHQGDNVARTFESAPPTLRQLDRVSTLLDQQNAVLNRLVVSAEKNVSAAAGPLDSLVDAARQTLGVVTANRRALDGSLVELPSTLAEARTTLDNLSGAADHTATVLSGVRPLTDHLSDASRELHGFSTAAKPALESLPEVLDKTDRLLEQAKPVVKELGPGADRLRAVSTSARSLRDDLMTHPPGIPSAVENLMTFMSDWAMSATGYDGISHYFKFKLLVTPSTALTLAGSVLPPTTRGEHDPLNPRPPNPTGPNTPSTKPYLPALPALPSLDGPDNSSHSTPRNAPRTPQTQPGSGSASGVTPKQESNLFSQLLGGG